METLAEKLKIVALEIKTHEEKLPHNQPNFIHLKNLEDFCNHRQLQSNDVQEVFICFSLSHLIRSFFYNFCGDTPYDIELHTVRINFYRFFSEKLFQLSECASSAKFDEMISLMCELTKSFLGAIKYLNKSK